MICLYVNALLCTLQHIVDATQRCQFSELTPLICIACIYTLNVSCIMLVYYFVPFIVSNRYLLYIYIYIYYLIWLLHFTGVHHNQGAR
jgi:cytochrome c biogenesis protein CcdA